MNAESPDIQSYRLVLDRLILPRFAARDSRGPIIVALEGANGAGKSTLCATLSAALGAPCCLGTDAAWFAEPFKVRMIRDADWPASAMFFLSGCLEQMRCLRGRAERLVIMDRCLWSTLAVQAATNPDRLAALLTMLTPVAAEIRVPDLTVVVDASFAACQSRIAQKTGAARALDELTANAKFHARERAFYRWLEQRQPGVKFLDVDQRNREEAATAAAALIREWAPC